MLLLLTGCGSGTLSGQQQQLALARFRWEAQNLRSYRFTIRRSGFISPEAQGPVVITVRKGVAETAPESFEAYNTVEKLFGLLEAAYQSHADTVTVQYEAVRGLPTSLFIDQSLQIADEEYGLSVTDFTPL